MGLRKKIISGKALNRLLKFLLVVLLLAALYFDFSNKEKLDEVWQLFKIQLHSANAVWVLATLLLMPLNWLTETEKWFNLLKRYEKKLTRAHAIKAVLAGVSFSIFTPNRIGEYGGRVLFVSKKNQWKAVIINILGNISQIIVLLGVGAWGLIYMLNRFFETAPLINTALLMSWFIGSTLMLLGFFNIDIIIPLARRIPFLHHIKRFVKDIAVLRKFSNEELRAVLLFSLLRYGIYSVQYYLLLRFFGVQIGLLEALAGISTIFLLQTSIPLPPIMGLLARGNIAIYIWHFFYANELSVLAATFTLWVINLILPSFFGVLFIVNTNIAKSIGYDDEP